MNIRKSISLITIFIFSFVICIACAMNVAKAQVRGDYPTCIDGECGNEPEKSENSVNATVGMTNRAADYFQRDTSTNAWGGIMNQFSYGPDAGWGETGQGYEYTNPMTGASVSYKVTGMGMGSIALPMYGGMNSALGAQSYGPYAYGNQPVTQPTYGYDSQSSQAGNAFGQGYEYTRSQPNLTAMVGTSLLSNPFTMGSGLALAAMSGAFSDFGASGYGASGYGASGYPGGYAAGGAYGASGYGGVPSYGGYGGYAGSGAYGSPAGYSSGYGVPNNYGGYAGSSAYGYPQAGYGGGYGGYAGSSAYGYPQAGYSSGYASGGYYPSSGYAGGYSQGGYPGGYSQGGYPGGYSQGGYPGYY